MTTSYIVRLPRHRLARITGGLYLGFVLALTLADVFGHIGIVDVERAYEVATTDPSQFAVGLAFGLLSAVLFVMAAWSLFVLLAPINRDLALLFLLLNAVGVAIQVASYLPVMFLMLSTGGLGSTGAAPLSQVEGLRYLELHGVGFATAQLFFGSWLFPLGYLVYKAPFLPKFLGALLILDGFAVLLWFVQAILIPDNPGISVPGLVLSFVAEVGLGLWLLVRGTGVAGDAPKRLT
jgi:hypothetical protein